MKAQKEKRAVEKALIFLENTEEIVNRILVEIQTVKANLMRSQMKMRNILLETERKASLL